MKIHELGHIVFYVSDLSRMADFYRDILGFSEIVRKWPLAVFSSGRTHHEMLLIEVGGEPQKKGQRPGLYHVGFKVANTHEELKEVFRELKEKRVPIVGTGDHTVTESIYILDPDGNELELYADVSNVWKKDPLSIVSPVKPLDLKD